MLRIAVAGNRSYENYDLIAEQLDHYVNLFRVMDPAIEIITGGARGVDRSVMEYADRHKIPQQTIRPDYGKFPPKVAPVLRNTTIAEISDIALFFWDGKSKGTKDTINKVLKLGKHAIVIPIGGE